MGSMQKIFNFDNIGGKIKALAKWSCWINIFLTWIGAIIAFFILLFSKDTFYIAFLIPIAAAIYSLLVWIGSWSMYALGEHVEDTHAIRNKYYPAEEEQLSISDIENAVSNYLNRRVSISDITCTLIYVIPQSTGIPKEMHLDMAVGDQEFTSLDLFFDHRRHAYYIEDRHLALDGAWRSEEEIFGFDVSLFKSFDAEVDEDD